MNAFSLSPSRHPGGSSFRTLALPPPSTTSSPSLPVEIVRELPLDQILLGDAVRMMRMLPAASVHCVFADPPYNLQLRGELRRPDDSLVDGVDDDWDRAAGAGLPVTVDD